VSDNDLDDHDLDDHDLDDHLSGHLLQVCDFGLSRVRMSTVLSGKSQAGTPEWTAPEVLRSQAYDESSDCYSCVTLPSSYTLSAHLLHCRNHRPESSLTG